MARAVASTRFEAAARKRKRGREQEGSILEEAGYERDGERSLPS
jgi:hypothetical protein